MHRLRKAGLLVPIARAAVLIEVMPAHLIPTKFIFATTGSVKLGNSPREVDEAFVKSRLIRPTRHRSALSVGSGSCRTGLRSAENARHPSRWNSR